MTDLLSLVTIPFLFVSLFTFVLIVHKQCHIIDSDTSRLVVLSTRTAMAFPLFAIITYITIPVPVLYAAMDVLIAAVVGYAFYTFLVLMVTNMGGPSATVELLNRSHKSSPCQRFCCPADKLDFYRRVCMNVFQLLVARVVVIAVATVLYYVNNGVTTVMCVVLKLLALAMMVHGMLSIDSLYWALFAVNRNLHGVLKLGLLKVVVLLIAVQGVVADMMHRFGDAGKEQIQRHYGALILLELTALSPLIYYAFSRVMVAPSSSYIDYVSQQRPQEVNVSSSLKAEGGETEIRPSAVWFIRQLFVFHDVFGQLEVVQEQPNSPCHGYRELDNDGVQLNPTIVV